jgi:hypothetical protein
MTALIRKPWTKQPPVGVIVDHPYFPPESSGVWSLNASLKNSVPGSVAGDAAWPSNGTHGYEARSRIGRGLSFDNTASPAASAITFPAANGVDGFWHDAFTEMTMFGVCTLEDDTFGMQILWDFGDSVDGLAIGYRTSPDTIVARIQATGLGGDVEIASTSTFTPNSTLFVAVRYSGSEATLKLWINGVLEAETGIATADVDAQTSQPGLGDKNGSTAFPDTDEDEWGGIISLAGITRRALPDEFCRQLTINPWQIFAPQKIFIPPKPNRKLVRF